MKAIVNDTINGQAGVLFRTGASTVLFLAALVLVLVGQTVSPALGQEIGGGKNSGEFDYSKIDLRVGVWLDHDEKEVYQRGQEMGAGFQTSTDAYAVVYRIDVDGLVTVLWPRSRMDNGAARRPQLNSPVHRSWMAGGVTHEVARRHARRNGRTTENGAGRVLAVYKQARALNHELRRTRVRVHDHPVRCDRFGHDR